MLTEPLPIEIFVNMRFEERRVAKFVESWPIETNVLAGLVIAHFKEMGIFSVNGFTADLLVEQMLQLLKNSPRVAEMLHKAALAEAARRQSRHAQIGK